MGAFHSPVTPLIVTSALGVDFPPDGTNERRKAHAGEDIDGVIGDGVRAPAAAVVREVKRSTFGGLTVILDHDDGFISSYLHLSRSLVQAGDRVGPGQLIAEIGNSGRVQVTVDAGGVRRKLTHTSRNGVRIGDTLIVDGVAATVVADGSHLHWNVFNRLGKRVSGLRLIGDGRRPGGVNLAAVALFAIPTLAGIGWLLRKLFKGV